MADESFSAEVLIKGGEIREKNDVAKGRVETVETENPEQVVETSLCCQSLGMQCCQSGLYLSFQGFGE